MTVLLKCNEALSHMSISLFHRPFFIIYNLLYILKMVYSINRIHFIVEIICHQFLFRPYHGYVCRELVSTTIMLYLLLLPFKTHGLANTRFLCYGSFIFKCYNDSLFLRAEAICL